MTLVTDKRIAILQAAIGAFAAYGFKRCSMADIAEAAGVSRPALYQHFSNKTEIYRAAAAHMQAQCLDAIKAIPEGPLADHLGAILIAYKGPFWRVISETPHGRELADLNTALAEDITREGIEVVVVFLADLMARHAAKGWDAEQVARLLSASAWTVMERAESREAFDADMRGLGRLYASAISVETA